jgi:hypothetical protein
MRTVAPVQVPFVEEVLCVSGPAGLGQVYRERTRLGGMSGVSHWQVVEWQPPHRQVQLSTDMRMNSRLIIEVEPSAGGDSAAPGDRAALDAARTARPVARIRLRPGRRSWHPPGGRRGQAQTGGVLSSPAGVRWRLMA